MTFPDFIGIGAQKCATSWIEKVLDEHQEICMAKTHGDKDTKFFSCYYDRGHQWYESHFAHNDGELATGEMSTSYFYNSDAPSRIRDYNKDMKILVCLRDPVDRILSNHRHELRMGHVSGDNMLLRNAINNNPMYITQSLYFSHIEKWLACFDRKQILVLIYEDIKTSPEKFIKSIYEFIGVNEEAVPPSLGSKVNVSTLKPKNLINRIMKYTEKITGYDPKSLINSLSSHPVDAKSQFDKFLEIDTETHALLLKILQPDSKLLENWLGRELPWYKI